MKCSVTLTPDLGRNPGYRLSFKCYCSYTVTVILAFVFWSAPVPVSSRCRRMSWHCFGGVAIPSRVSSMRYLSSWALRCFSHLIHVHETSGTPDWEWLLLEVAPEVSLLFLTSVHCRRFTLPSQLRHCYYADSVPSERTSSGKSGFNKLTMTAVTTVPAASATR